MFLTNKYIFRLKHGTIVDNCYFLLDVKLINVGEIAKMIRIYIWSYKLVYDGKIVGVMMIDLSAAFDMVDHPLLLEKLRLFGLEEEVIQWFDSYLSGRT